MKPDTISILLWGKDAQLLETRQWVLQSRGYRVTVIAKLSDIRALRQSPPFTLFILCHSLSPEEARAAFAVASFRWPGIKQLVLVADTTRSPTGLLGQLLHTMNGPGALLATVHQLVSDRIHAVPSPHHH